MDSMMRNDINDLILGALEYRDHQYSKMRDRLTEYLIEKARERGQTICDHFARMLDKVLKDLRADVFEHHFALFGSICNIVEQRLTHIGAFLVEE